MSKIHVILYHEDKRILGSHDNTELEALAGGGTKIGSDAIWVMVLNRRGLLDFLRFGHAR